MLECDKYLVIGVFLSFQ